MYGYRRKDIGLLRLFLPTELHVVFRAISKMERGLRELIAQAPSEEFRGVYVEGPLSPTRTNVLAPGAIGVYSGGSTYNPAQVLRNETTTTFTAKIDDMLKGLSSKTYQEFSMQDIRKLIELTLPDQNQSEKVWNPIAVAESVSQFASLQGQTIGYVYVDRDRAINESRRETQGILSGGEAGKVPDDKLTLFLLRMVPGKGSRAAWWPQIRFPKGRYAFAFAV
jgi:hypothetical protein